MAGNLPASAGPGRQRADFACLARGLVPDWRAEVARGVSRSPADAVTTPPSSRPSRVESLDELIGRIANINALRRRSPPSWPPFP